MLTKSKAQTQKIAIRLAKNIIANRHEPSRMAVVIALIGDLGSGKTVFTQGFIRSLGIKTHAPSPTFLIYRKYKIFSDQRPTTNDQRQPKNEFKNVFHFDLYRIQKPKEIIDLDFKKIIKNPENIVLIEWPKAIMKYLPKDTICVEFEHGKRANERAVNVKCKYQKSKFKK